MSSSIPTPDTSHLTTKDYDYVYEPAEDSFLLLDALEQDADFLRKKSVSICLEVGCGSGVAITFLGQIIGSKALYLCTDINPMAAKASKETGNRNCVNVNPVITDLVSCLEDRLMGNVDVLLFNPPYVVTPSEEVGSHGIEASWAGGDRGRQVSDRLFPIIGNLLAPGGAFYLVIVKENNEDEIISMMKAQGLVGSAVLRRRVGPEHLSILKFNKPG